MPDALAVISRVISEHHAIRQHVRLAGDSLNDFEALFSLHQAQSTLSQSSIENLDEKQTQMQQAVTSLEQGLKTHFAFEEKYLLPLFGELLAQAFLHEHHKIAGQIESARKTLADTRLEGLSRQELFARKSGMQQTINDLCQVVDEHASHEEIILNMMKKTLEAGGKL